MPEYILKWNEQKIMYDSAIDIWKTTGCTWSEALAEVTGKDECDVQESMPVDIAYERWKDKHSK